MAASVRLNVFLITFVQFAIVNLESTSVENCAMKTKFVQCACEGGLIRLRQCFDQRSSSCKSCSDESMICARKCSRGPSGTLKASPVKSRQRRAAEHCIFEDGVGRGKPVINTLISRTVQEGYQASMFCNISSNPRPTKIEWIFKHELDQPAETLDCSVDTGDYTDSCKLKQCGQEIIFELVGENRKGNYTCVVENAVGKVNATAFLMVNPRPDNPNPILTEYKMSSNSKNVLYVGRSVNLTCQGYDSNLITWYKDGKRFPEDDLHIIHQPVPPDIGYRATGKLEFKNISFNDSGAYYCVMSKPPLPKRATSKILNFTVGECPSRYFCSFDNNINICPRGFYCSANSFSPTPCPEGTFCPEGSEGIGQCPSGYYCPEPGVKKLKADEPEQSDATDVYFTIAIVIPLVAVGFAAWCLLKRRYPKLECHSGSHEEYGLRFRESDVESSDTRKLNGECGHAQECKWDVFICYSSKDGDWVREVLMEEIEKRGLKVCIDIRDFMPGEAIVQNIVDAIYGSRKTVAVLSPNYVKSDWCKDELQRAITLGITRHQVVPILYKPCKVPRLLLDKTYLDWTNDEVKPHFWDLLYKSLQPDLRVSAV